MYQLLQDDAKISREVLLFLATSDQAVRVAQHYSVERPIKTKQVFDKAKCGSEIGVLVTLGRFDKI